MKTRLKGLLALFAATLAAPAMAAYAGPTLAGVPVDFFLFALTLVGVALFHNYTLKVALTGLVTVTLYKLIFTGFKHGAGFVGLASHLGHEWVTLANLLCLLTGFALLARHFEESQVPSILPKFLPDDWKGGFVLLVMVFVISSFLDNIAAALIGGAMAQQLFRGKVSIGFLAAIVAASNAGGSGSVVGDTTTTMMWISNISPLAVLHGYIAAFVALLIVGYFAAKQQHAHAPITKDSDPDAKIEWNRVGVVGLMLVFAVATNVFINLIFPAVADAFPFIGVAVWAAVLVSVPLAKHDWEILPETVKGSVFLLSLVLMASMMPVEELPPASWQSALALGFVSAGFDNIPLTALAIKQGGFDWGVLAYCVGFGGSMLWFGSSAGVALSNRFPEARSAVLWLKHGWHVPVAYVAGFFTLLMTWGWHPA